MKNTTILLIFSVIISFSLGYVSGIRTGGNYVLEQQDLLQAQANFDSFDDCEGNHISSIKECYGDD